MSNFKEIEPLVSTDLQSAKYIGGIPWLFSNPEKSFLEWSEKTQAYFLNEENQLSHLQGLLNQNSLNNKSKKRVQQLINDKHAHLKQMKKLLDDFTKNQNPNIILDTQNILSYQDNIFRDWCWGQEENQIYVDYITNELSDSEKNILVLGAGSCGFSYELSKKTSANVVAIDINPYLFLVANKILNKKHVKLHEFLTYPDEIQAISKKWEIKPVDTQENHFQVFCDFTNMPFKENSFDVVIGCWFYDIIDPKLDQSLKHINKYLNNDGKSFFIGPSNFHKKQVEDKLTKEEIIRIYADNYQDVSFKLDKVNYLNNPSNSYQRLENILFLKAKQKTSEEYLYNSEKEDTLIQTTPELLAYKQKIEVFHRILKYLDRPTTLNALSRNVQKEFGFTEDEAKYYTESVIKKLNIELS